VGGLDGGGLIPGGPFIKEGCALTPGGAAPGVFGGSFGGGGNPEGDFIGALGGALGGRPGGPDAGALGGPDREGGPDRGVPAEAGPDDAITGADPPPWVPDNILNSKFAAFSRAFWPDLIPTIGWVADAAAGVDSTSYFPTFMLFNSFSVLLKSLSSIELDLLMSSIREANSLSPSRKEIIIFSSFSWVFAFFGI
jgi:hypothetical protein